MANGFAWTTLHIGDLDKSLALYRDIMGMKEIKRYRIEVVDETIAILESADGARLELVQVPGYKLELTEQENFSLAFEVDDAMAIIEQIGSECRMHVEIDAETQFFFTNDPDGYPLNLIERK
jgi:lactoylglutathione lyase